MIHRYEGVAVAKVVGYIEADTPEEARELLMARELGTVTDVCLQSVTLLDDLEDNVTGDTDENFNDAGRSSARGTHPEGG